MITDTKNNAYSAMVAAHDAAKAARNRLMVALGRWEVNRDHDALVAAIHEDRLAGDALHAACRVETAK